MHGPAPINLARQSPGTFNRYLTALKHFYNSLDDAQGRLPPEVDAEIRSLCASGLTRKAIAAQVGFSRETVGKALKRKPAKPGDEESLATIRLRVIAFTGLRHGQVAKLRPDHYERADVTGGRHRKTETEVTPGFKWF